MDNEKTLQKFIHTFCQNDLLGQLLGARFVSLTPHECIYEYDASPSHFNPNGILHGGVLFSIMDSSQGMLVHSNLEPEYKAAATGTATIRYLAPMRSGTARICTILKGREGRKLFVYSEAKNSQGETLAVLEEIWITILKS